jgi:hypothetical protein
MHWEFARFWLFYGTNLWNPFPKGAATAKENNLVLASANAKHFKPIRDLELKVFKP